MGVRIHFYGVYFSKHDIRGNLAQRFWEMNSHRQTFALPAPVSPIAKANPQRIPNIALFGSICRHWKYR